MPFASIRHIANPLIKVHEAGSAYTYISVVFILSYKALQAKVKKHGAFKPGMRLAGSESFEQRAVVKRFFCAYQSGQ